MKKLFLALFALALVLTACPSTTDVVDDGVDDGKDNGDNTSLIGTKGPGGGTIFFAEGDQLMECSGELGSTTYNEALTLAQSHKSGGFTDWHLPTRRELDLMYKNLKQKDLGGFSNEIYWTSEKRYSNEAYCQDFSDGSTGPTYMSNSFNVRVVRSYSTDSVATISLNIKNQSATDLEKVIWQGVDFGTITAGSIGTKTVPAGSGYIYFTRKTNPINARTSSIVAVEDGTTEFVFLDTTLIVDVDNITNTGTLSALQPLVTSLTIKNESFTEITDVIWQSVSFANNQYENSIKTGSNVNQTVTEGAGYIFFKGKTNSVIARTSEMVIVLKDESKIFTFTDDTPIVEVNNIGNTGTLGTMQTTVVWFDDAEGEMQPYYERRSFVGYYEAGDNLLQPNSSDNYFYRPKNGSKSIAVGGTSTALLHLRVNLSKKAKLSFWFANRVNSINGALLSINGVEVKKWSSNIDWSYIEFELEPGQNDLIWEKRDGYYSYYYCYLSLDDILIYYTE